MVRSPECLNRCFGKFTQNFVEKSSHSHAWSVFCLLDVAGEDCTVWLDLWMTPSSLKVALLQFVTKPFSTGCLFQIYIVRAANSTGLWLSKMGKAISFWVWGLHKTHALFHWFPNRGTHTPGEREVTNKILSFGVHLILPHPKITFNTKHVFLTEKMQHLVWKWENCSANTWLQTNCLIFCGRNLLHPPKQCAFGRLRAKISLI